MSNVIVVIGPGLIGQAIARRVGVGKHVLLADLREENANAAAETLGNAGYDAHRQLPEALSQLTRFHAREMSISPCRATLAPELMSNAPPGDQFKPTSIMERPRDSALGKRQICALRSQTDRRILSP